ncbi:MAG: hypothetical protein ACE5HI_20340 [bacterium]
MSYEGNNFDFFATLTDEGIGFINASDEFGPAKRNLCNLFGNRLYGWRNARFGTFLGIGSDLLTSVSRRSDDLYICSSEQLFV